MFLKRLTLQDIRSIAHLDLSFETEEGQVRKWTLILGENGAGKSTVLRAAALVTAGSEALPELLEQPDAWIRIGSESCSIAADLVTAEGEERHISLSWSRGQSIREIFDKNRASLDRLDAALSHTDRNYFTVGYGTSRRLPGIRSSAPMREVYSHPRAARVATLFSNDAVLNPLDTWAMDLDYRRKGDGIDIIRNALGELLPGMTLLRIDKERRALLFETPDGEVALDQLSDGYQNAAGWYGDLLYRITETYQDYKHPLQARGLLLVDEIDLHLHPLWQRRLQQFLHKRMPNFQVLATTHSPLTAQEAGAGELYFLRRPQPTAPAALEEYHGAPNRLFTHQVLMSPAFGLESVNSKRVQDMRTEYEQLKGKAAKLRPAEKRRMDALAEQLADLPDWRRETEQERRQTALLEDIRAALESGKQE
jgi:energy-coupling factor transporter ATP-binding protein EcfA2